MIVFLDRLRRGARVTCLVLIIKEGSPNLCCLDLGSRQESQVPVTFVILQYYAKCVFDLFLNQTSRMEHSTGRGGRVG